MSSSPKKAWNQVLEANSPSTCAKHLPVIPFLTKMLPTINKDEVLKKLAWILLHNEEYYYFAAIEFIGLSLDESNSKMSQAIRKNRLPSQWMDIMTDLSLIGKGNYGQVYKALDRRDQETKYAVKRMTNAPRADSEELMLYVALPVVERQAMVRANNSPFVVQLLGSFQDSQVWDFWMVMELCIGNLTEYISYIRVPMNNFLQQMLNGNVLQYYYDAYRETMQLDVENIACLYALELLAGASFLADRLLIHGDLKPDNILVSATGHLKIADLGLAQRMRWVDRLESFEMLGQKSLKLAELRGNEIPTVGNRLYADPEQWIEAESLLPKDAMFELLDHPFLPLLPEIVVQDFLSDLYAVGLIIMDILFLDMNVLRILQLSKDMDERFNCHKVHKIEFMWNIRCIYEHYVYNEGLQPVLNNQKTKTNRSIIGLLQSIFQPKPIRGMRITRDIQYYRMQTLVNSRCVDIEKILTNVDYYRDRKITHYTVNSYPMKNMIRRIFPERPPKGEVFKNFNDIEVNPELGRDFYIPAFSFNL